MGATEAAEKRGGVEAAVRGGVETAGERGGVEAAEMGVGMEATVMKVLEGKLGSPIDHGPQVPRPKPLVIIISGPSGVGKDAVIKVRFRFQGIQLAPGTSSNSY